MESHGTAIPHCPLSNAYFSAEPFHLREALQQGIKVGLGTDVAGGYSLDIMNAMRHSVAVSRMREGSRNIVQSNDQRSQAQCDRCEFGHRLEGGTLLRNTGWYTSIGSSFGNWNVHSWLSFDAQQSTLDSSFFMIVTHFHRNTRQSDFSILQLGLVTARSISLT